MDVACGSLRGGIHFIPYLGRGNSLGLEIERALVDAALSHELAAAVVEDKAPEFVISSALEFERFSRRPDYAIAQSSFTHLVPDEARLCLTTLRGFVQQGCRFYVTFLEGDSSGNPPSSHTHLRFDYSQTEMRDLASDTGRDFEYLGAWGPPRGQVMSLLTPR